MEPELNKCVSKHVRINTEVSYKEAEPLTWSSSGSSYSSDSLDLSFGENDVLKLPPHSGTTSSLPPEVSPRGGGAGKPLAYDPNRIPAFVFSSKSAGPMDWSVASNESLFSIHMGNNSFSKDLPILLAKSQELGKLDEMSANYQTGGRSPAIEAAGPERETAHMKKRSEGKTASAEASTMDSAKNLEDRAKQNLIPSVENHTSAVDTFHSDGLTKDDTRNSSAKVEEKTEKRSSLPHNPAEDSEKQQQSQPQTPAATAIPNAAGCNWLSCFSCFSGFTCRPLCCRRPTISS